MAMHALQCNLRKPSNGFKGAALLYVLDVIPDEGCGPCIVEIGRLWPSAAAAAIVGQMPISRPRMRTVLLNLRCG